MRPKDGNTDHNLSGNIYTCTNGHGFYSQPDLITNCGSNTDSLTVYGSLTARRIAFLRLAGTTGDPAAAPSSTAQASTAAEKIINGPATWLSDPTTATSTTQYDAIASLPPVF